MLKYNQSNEELKSSKNELYMTKDKLDRAGNNTNEKTKYIDELKEIQKKFGYQNNKVKKLESELNEKNENIKFLENENLRIVNESNRINKKCYDKIQQLEKELEYFDANDNDDEALMY